MLLLLVLVGVLVGAVLAGGGVRWVVGRLPRATHVRAGACEAGLVVAWMPVAGALVGGVTTPAWAPLWLGVGVLAVAGTATDVVDHRLPDALTITALPVVLLLTVPLGGGAVGRAALGALVLLTAFVAVSLTAPGALGGGDVKLAPSVGAALAAASWWAVPAGVLLAAGAVLVAAAIRRRRAVPYGPPVLVSTWLVVGTAAITLGRTG